MPRIELELYADRLARHAERLRDDVDGARLRLAWAELEGRVRAELGARDAAVLEALGVLVAVDAAARAAAARARLRQLRALSGCRRSSSASSPDAAGQDDRVGWPFISGASDASRPPSSS